MADSEKVATNRKRNTCALSRKWYRDIENVLSICLTPNNVFISAIATIGTGDLRLAILPYSRLCHRIRLMLVYTYQCPESRRIRGYSPHNNKLLISKNFPVCLPSNSDYPRGQRTAIYIIVLTHTNFQPN